MSLYKVSLEKTHVNEIKIAQMVSFATKRMRRDFVLLNLLQIELVMMMICVCAANV